jgi:TolB-like protein/rhodanese-related sulfurtransferase/tetratricopeptide (TPR) repeat protein
LCISCAANDQIRDKLSLAFADLGEQTVKNISRAVGVFGLTVKDIAALPEEPVIISSETAEAGPVKGMTATLRRAPVFAALAGTVLIVLGSGIWWLNAGKVGQRGQVETSPIAAQTTMPEPATKSTVTLTPAALSVAGAPGTVATINPAPRLSIVVLPFINLSSDPEQEYFADGITDDLTTDLSRIPGSFVIARNSAFAYKGKTVDAKQVGRELGVHYVLEGSVRRSAARVRINAQLIDATGGQHLWADRYDGTTSDVFGLQDKVIRQIVGALAVELTGTVRAGGVETNNPEAYDAVLQGWDHLRKDSEEEMLKAIASFEKAIELDRGYGRAYAALAAANLRIVVSYWEAAAGAGFEHAFEGMKENLAKALEKPTSLAFAVSGEILAREGRYDQAFAAIEKAMALAPCDPENYIAKAKILNASGRAAEAEEAARAAMRFDPRYAPGTLRVLAQSLFHQEKYEDAVATFKRVLSQQSDVAEDYATLVSSLGHLGRREGVQDAIDKYNALAPKFGYDPLTVQEMGWWWYDDMFNYDDTYRARLQEGLRNAGVPEGAGSDLAYADYKRLIVKKEGEYDVLGVTGIDASTAKVLHDRRGVIFVDVRAVTDFDRGHIPGAKNLSLATHLSNETLANVAGKDDEIVFSCMGKYCSYSAYASAKALLWGYTHVHRFAGGFAAWQDAGYPTETSGSQTQGDTRP